MKSGIYIYPPTNGLNKIHDCFLTEYTTHKQALILRIRYSETRRYIACCPLCNPLATLQTIKNQTHKHTHTHILSLTHTHHTYTHKCIHAAQTSSRRQNTTQTPKYTLTLSLTHRHTFPHANINARTHTRHSSQCCPPRTLQAILTAAGKASSSAFTTCTSA